MVTVRRHYRKTKKGKVPIRRHRRILSIAKRVKNKIKPFSKRVEIAGSIRRGKKPEDVDIVVIPKDKDSILKAISKEGKIKSKGKQQIFSKIDDVDVDIFFSKADEFGAQLLTRTGPAGANISNRVLAKSKGLNLNQHGLFKGKKRVAGKTEKEIYKKLGKTYRPPTKRGEPRHPREIGSIWYGEGYIHGPRLRDPKKFSAFRLGKKNKDGSRLVFGKNRKTGKWQIQSKIRPRK